MIKICISVTSHALDHLPLSQTVTPSRIPSPLERDVLYGRPPILYEGSIALASIITTHLIQDRVFGVCLAGRLPFCASLAALSLFLYTAVTWPWRVGDPIRPLCDNADPFFFCRWSHNLERASLRYKSASNRCLFSIP